MYTLEDIERIVKPENLIACRGDKKNPFDMHIDGANYYKDPKTQEIYRLSKKKKRRYDRVLEKINDNEKIILDKLKKFPNEKLFNKQVVNQKDIWFFNVSTEEKDQSFLEKHKAIESECKKDDFIERSNKKIKSLQRQKKEKRDNTKQFNYCTTRPNHKIRKYYSSRRYRFRIYEKRRLCTTKNWNPLLPRSRRF